MRLLVTRPFRGQRNEGGKDGGRDEEEEKEDEDEGWAVVHNIEKINYT